MLSSFDLDHFFGGQTQPLGGREEQHHQSSFHSHPPLGQLWGASYWILSVQDTQPLFALQKRLESDSPEVAASLFFFASGRRLGGQHPAADPLGVTWSQTTAVQRSSSKAAISLPA